MRKKKSANDGRGVPAARARHALADEREPEHAPLAHPHERHKRPRLARNPRRDRRHMRPHARAEHAARDRARAPCFPPTAARVHETRPACSERRDSPFPISHYRDPCRGTPHFPMSRFHRGVEFFIFDVGVRADIFLFDVRDFPDFRGIFSEDRLRPRGNFLKYQILSLAGKSSKSHNHKNDASSMPKRADFTCLPE